MKSSKPLTRSPSAAPRLLSSPLREGRGGLLLSLLLLLAFPVQADPARDEARAQALFREVRCVVCQSETIADSDADIAADMRRDIRARIAAGESDADIRKDLYTRYGDYVLFRPRVSKANLLLWILPPLIVLCGVTGLILLVRRRSESKSYELSDDEQRKLRDILNKPD